MNYTIMQSSKILFEELELSRMMSICAQVERVSQLKQEKPTTVDGVFSMHDQYFNPIRFYAEAVRASLWQPAYTQNPSIEMLFLGKLNVPILRCGYGDDEGYMSISLVLNYQKT